MSIHCSKKAKKLAISNAKLSWDEREKPKLIDIYMTEKSLRDGFQHLFGERCDIFAKLLYIKASKCVDHFKLTVLDFHKLFAPMFSDRAEHRVSAVFNLLDTQSTGELEILPLIQLYV